MKMRTPHIAPLAKQALDVLDTLHTLSGKSEWLFPGDRNSKKPMSNNTILKALERMGYKGRITGHGFRGWRPRFCMNGAVRMSILSCSLLTHHAMRSALRTTMRSRMMQDWADFLEHTQRGGKVLSFRGSVA
jgi:integrase